MQLGTHVSAVSRRHLVKRPETTTARHQIRHTMQEELIACNVIPNLQLLVNTGGGVVQHLSPGRINYLVLASL